MQLSEIPHKRFNPLTGEWVLVSPHRLKRPWQGKTERIAGDDRPRHDPKCYLCPGNERAGGEHNPDYTGTFVFTNDFRALLDDVPDESIDESGLLVARTEKGTCRVICFSPRHDLTLAEMETPAIRGVVDAWISEFRNLAAQPGIAYVQIFENKGQLMGCSNPHPHGQVWATSSLPVEIEKEDANQRLYADRHDGRTLLADYLDIEVARNERIVVENEHWVALVPWWAKWPFETMVIPRNPVQRIDDLEAAGCDALADVIRRLTTHYDNLFEISFPYTMGFHQAPVRGDHPHWHLHMHFYPPLLRSATVQKFMVGFEMLATPQRDLTAEQAAERLRSVSEIHYKRQATLEAKHQ